MPVLVYSSLAAGRKPRTATENRRMNIKYIFGALLAIPLLPVMYFQGKRIRASVPRLPEAEGVEGICRAGSADCRTLQVILTGESTIAGVGVKTHEEGFTGAFARVLSGLLRVNVSWKVYARSGYTAKKLREKIVPVMTPQHADLIIVGLGGNDAFTLSSPAQWRAEISALVESLHVRYPEAAIVFCNMPPIKEFPAFTPLIKFIIGNLVEILGEELKAVEASYSYVHYVGEKITLKVWMERYQLHADRAEFFSDGVHPSKLTYQTWAKDLAINIAGNKKTGIAPGQNV